MHEAQMQKRMEAHEEIYVSLNDAEWPRTSITHDRVTARAIVVDDAGKFCFVRVDRNDEFGNCMHIETPGGGVEPGEDLIAALRRELLEEIGAEVEILCRIGWVSDYYNLIRRHNISHYFLHYGALRSRHKYVMNKLSSTSVITLLFCN